MKIFATAILLLASAGVHSAIVQVTLEGNLQNYSTHPADLPGLNGSSITVQFSYDDSIAYDQFTSCNCNSGGSYLFDSAFGGLQVAVSGRTSGLADFSIFSQELQASAVDSFDGDTLSMNGPVGGGWTAPIDSISGTAAVSGIYLGNVNLSMVSSSYLPSVHAWNFNEYWWGNPTIAVTVDGNSHSYYMTNLTSSAAIVSAHVPVPAAVWLFGSALAGLGWMKRKRTA